MTEERGVYKVEGRTEPRRETLLPFKSQLYRAPTKDEFRSVTQTLGLTGSMVGALLGVTSRAVRKWIGGESEVPYSAWRLLLTHAGIAEKDPDDPQLDDLRAMAHADLSAQDAYADDRQLTWGEFKDAVEAKGVRDRDVIERMQFVSKKFEVCTVNQNPGEPLYVQVVTPKTD